MSIRIMVAICHGVQNREAIALAIRWAKRFGGIVTGVGFLNESAVAPTYSMSLPGGSAPVISPEAMIMASATKKVQDSLEEFQQRCRREEVEYRLAEDLATSHEEIFLEAQSHDVLLFGKPEDFETDASITAQNLVRDLLRHSPRPVVLVPDTTIKGHGILVAYDGSLQAARALQALVAGGLTALGKVTVLTVRDEFREDENTSGRRAVEYLAAHGVDAAEYQVADSAAEYAIIEEAKHRNVELIVMGAYGQSKFAEFFLGSTTGKVIDESTIPVFLFH